MGDEFLKCRPSRGFGQATLVIRSRTLGVQLVYKWTKKFAVGSRPTFRCGNGLRGPANPEWDADVSAVKMKRAYFESSALVANSMLVTGSTE